MTYLPFQMGTRSPFPSPTRNHFSGNFLAVRKRLFAYSGFTRDSGMGKRTKAKRLAQARLEIATRIKRVCEVFLPADFERLLDRMARIQCKYEYVSQPR